jgi:hypothetical protein
MGGVAWWPAILTYATVEKEKREGVRFGTRHVAGGAVEGCGGLARRSGGVGWPAPACTGGRRAPVHNRGGGVAAKGARPQNRAAAVKFNLKSNSNRFKTDQNHSNFDHLKNDLLELEKFELKYGFEDLKKVNNFLHRIFFIFGMDFK